jgi:hypothetical protein
MLIGMRADIVSFPDDPFQQRHKLRIIKEDTCKEKPGLCMVFSQLIQDDIPAFRVTVTRKDKADHFGLGGATDDPAFGFGAGNVFVWAWSSHKGQRQGGGAPGDCEPFQKYNARDHPTMLDVFSSIGEQKNSFLRVAARVLILYAFNQLSGLRKARLFFGSRVPQLRLPCSGETR